MPVRTKKEKAQAQAQSRTFDYLLLGGGLASATAAETLRGEGAEGTIAIVAADAHLPYHRPPLSKKFLIGTEAEDRLLIQPRSFYKEKAIELLLETRATAVVPGEHVVVTAGGERLTYGKLLIATGGVANRLDLPGAGLAGIFTLRSRADSLAIRQAAAKAKRAIVVGGSFIALEVAASLTEMGVGVTVLERGPHLMSKLHAPSLSEFFRDYCTKRGVTVVLGAPVASFQGKDRVAAVVTTDGARHECDMAVLGVGITPETGFLAGSFIATGDGILGDEHLRTADPDIFAAGDVARFIDPVIGGRRRLEHWDNAVKQGRLAARNMLGRNLPYDELSYFFSDVFDLSFDVLGAPEEGEEWIARRSLARRNFGLFYLRNDVVRGVFSLGGPADETRSAEGMIRHRMNLAERKHSLADERFALDDISTQTVLILQGGGALGAFECGVVRALEEAQIYPDIVSGVSIGAFNGAIVASNPRHATAAIEAFWSDLAVATPDLLVRELTRAAVAMQILTLGVPNFFTPRWLAGFGLPNAVTRGWTSLYDTAPIRDLIARYVDFPRLRESPVRLLVSAVDVETSELKIFDSYVDDLTPDHIVASGSLPPGFDWTTIDGKHYWDGGIISNSPLDLVVERCGASGKRVFIVDLFSGKKPLPSSLMEVMARRDEIVFAERIRNDMRTRELVADFRGLIDEMLGWLKPEDATRIRHRPRYVQLMGDLAPMTITRIVREGEVGEPASRDYDFSQASVVRNRAEGYRLTVETLAAAQKAAAERD